MSRLRSLVARACAGLVATTSVTLLASVAPAHAAVSFATCSDAYAAGYANMRVGDPGYASHLDRDGDGVACENPPAGFVPHAPTPTPTPAPKPVPTKGQVYAVDAAGNLRYYQGTLAGMSYRGTRGGGWGGFTAIAQINDLTGDGTRDILARRGSDQSLWLYDGEADGYLRQVRQVGSGWGGMDQIVPVFNLAGGSTQYVVARRAADGALFRYTLSGSGLGNAVQIGTGWSGMRQILSVGDFSSDGRSDVLGIRSDGALFRYLGTTTGRLGDGKQVGNGWTSFVRAFSPGDLNGDGRFDLAGQRRDGVVFGYANNRGTWGSASQIITGTGTYKLLG